LIPQLLHRTNAGQRRQRQQEKNAVDAVETFGELVTFWTVAHQALRH
jgi:hypothetical protein